MSSGTAAAAVDPIANFTTNNTNGSAPLSVQFNDISTGNPTSWSWSFGDGNTSILKNPVHNYTKTGNFNVTLTVNNSVGSNSLQLTISVNNSPLMIIIISIFKQPIMVLIISRILEVEEGLMQSI